MRFLVSADLPSLKHDFVVLRATALRPRTRLYLEFQKCLHDCLIGIWCYFLEHYTTNMFVIR